jgi:hypothetical protein
LARRALGIMRFRHRPEATDARTRRAAKAIANFPFEETLEQIQMGRERGHGPESEVGAEVRMPPSSRPWTVAKLDRCRAGDPGSKLVQRPQV